MTLFVHDAILKELADAKRQYLLDQAAASRDAAVARSQRRRSRNLLFRRRRRPAVGEETRHTFPARTVASPPSAAQVDALAVLERVAEKEGVAPQLVSENESVAAQPTCA